MDHAREQAAKWRRLAAGLLPASTTLDDDGVLLALAASYRLALQREPATIGAAPGRRTEAAVAGRGLGGLCAASTAAMARSAAPYVRGRRAACTN
jgi:hypothetical protein